MAFNYVRFNLVEINRQRIMVDYQFYRGDDNANLIKGVGVGGGIRQHNPYSLLNQTHDYNNEIITLDDLLVLPFKRRKQILGEYLFPLTLEHCVKYGAEEHTGKVTGMLLEMDPKDVHFLISNPKTLKEKVIEALVLLIPETMKDKGEEIEKGEVIEEIDFEKIEKSKKNEKNEKIEKNMVEKRSLNDSRGERRNSVVEKRDTCDTCNDYYSLKIDIEEKERKIENLTEKNFSLYDEIISLIEERSRMEERIKSLEDENKEFLLENEKLKKEKKEGKSKFFDGKILEKEKNDVLDTL